MNGNWEVKGYTVYVMAKGTYGRVIKKYKCGTEEQAIMYAEQRCKEGHLVRIEQLRVYAGRLGTGRALK